jgi:cellobiose phosphorylase
MEARKQLAGGRNDDLTRMSEGQEMRSQRAVALLSNGSYSVMITSAGAGYSTWRLLDVTRWREDATRDCWGQFYYVRDLGDERMWSVAIQPLFKPADECAFELHQ